MKIITSELPKKREERMIARAISRIQRFQEDPDYVEKVSILILTDILELFRSKKLPTEETRIVAQALRSQRVIDLMNRLIDATVWCESEEGKKWLRQIEKNASAA